MRSCGEMVGRATNDRGGQLELSAMSKQQQQSLSVAIRQPLSATGLVFRGMAYWHDWHDWIQLSVLTLTWEYPN